MRAVFPHVLGLTLKLILSHFLQSREGKMSTNWRQPQMAGRRKAKKAKGKGIWMT